MSITTRNALTLLIAAVTFLLTPAYADTASPAIKWLNTKSVFFHDKINQNISPPDGLPGAIIAAKRTNVEPDYYYHWVRDAAITMLALIDTYPSMQNSDMKLHLRHQFFDYLDFSVRIQNTATLTDLGEPKFYVNGNAYNEPWGRPQNDGPALRAVSLIHWANILLAEGQEALVRQRLYDGMLPSHSPIKKDLEYISHHWKDPSFDLWEEVKGTHFYTLMVIRRALLEGATLANELGDTGAGLWYESQARQIELELQHFWNESQGYLTATINRVGGIDYKHSNLDTSVLLGLLHGGMNDGFLAWDNPKVIATLNKLTTTFAALYPVNQKNIPGIAIGRYPEDRYAGNNFDGGNPWPLCTLAVAEAYYQYANLLQSRHEAYEGIANLADSYVERVKFHAWPDGSVDEQINRDTGKMTSARDLTWNYAALLSTRQAALTGIQGRSQ